MKLVYKLIFPALFMLMILFYIIFRVFTQSQDIVVNTLKEHSYSMVLKNIDSKDIQKKKSIIKELDTFSIEIDKQVKIAQNEQIMYFISVTITLVLLFILLIYSNVLRPLSKIVKAIDEFSKFLNDNDKTPQKILINSNDEFGSIASSLNDNISTSAKLHNDLHALNSQLEELNYTLESQVIERTVELAKEKKHINELYKKIDDSVNYAAIIQHSLIPSFEPFFHYFSEHFTLWKPRDIVGGDIYLIEEITDDECLISVIDCTGHGIPGAFVTMLVKAIERQLMFETLNVSNEISPAKLLKQYNYLIQELLQQYDQDSLTDVGFEGGILYWNRVTKEIKYAGAHIPLYIVDENETKIIKGDRQLIGYKKSDTSFNFTEYKAILEEGTCLYISTDGYVDQTGGQKGYSFGKKRLKNLIEEIHNESMADQNEILLNTMQEYKKNFDTKDDMTILGFKI
jgi:serine phosphatase RsbU (regulator of sigma subunit)